MNSTAAATGICRNLPCLTYSRAVGSLEVLMTNPLWGIGILSLTGYAFGKVSERFGLPEITGFIIAGIVIGPQGLVLLDYRTTQELAVFTEIALAFLAFTVGGSLRSDVLKRVGTAIFLISSGHVLTTGVIVTASLILIGIHPAVAIMLGVIAGASSPGTTVALVRRERATGPFVEYLFGIIAVVNAAVITTFGLVFTIAQRMLGLPGAGSLLQIMGRSTGAIGLAVLLGLLTGYAILIATRRTRQPAAGTTILVSGFLLLGTSMGVALGLSPLLLNMTAGALFVNLSKRTEAVFRALEPLTPPIYALFFILAGTKFQWEAFAGGTLLLFGAVYILSRIAGLYWGYGWVRGWLVFPGVSDGMWDGVWYPRPV